MAGITLAGATDLAQVAAVSGRNPLLKTGIVALHSSLSL
jgi:hypothetical protein